MATRNSTILFVASNPTAIRFNFARELQGIEHAAGRRRAFDVVPRWSVSLAGIERELARTRADVVHLVSPGVDPGDDTLILADEGGSPQHVKPAALAGAFTGRRPAPKLVVLNTCHARPHAEAIAQHVGAVVAMDGVITDTAAIHFSDAFYRELAAGATLTSAFEVARGAVAQVTPEDGNTPVVIAGTKNPGAITIATGPGQASRRSARGVLGAAGPPDAAPPCIQIFCSYSHKDTKFRNELEVFLSTLRQQGAVHVWHDRFIAPGSDWARDIDRNLDAAGLILMLISADFVNSGYCMGVELRRALERHRIEGLPVIPILVRECDLEGLPFTALQWLPSGSTTKPVKSWRDRDAAWTNVAKGIRQVAEAVKSRAASLTR